MMEKPVSKLNHQMFTQSDKLFDSLDPLSASNLASIGADITLLIDDNGTVADVAYRDKALAVYNIDKWIGLEWQNTVTDECVEKIDALLAEHDKERITRKRQVNHAAEGHADLPVEYTLVSVDGISARLALGTDLRPLAEVQQKLLQIQMELETEYAKIREAEGRYRTIFHKTSQPMIVVDGENSQVIDINLTGANLIGQTADRVVNRPAAQLIERENRAELAEAINAARHAGTLKSLTLKFVGTKTELPVVIEPYRENGRGNIIISVIGDAAKGDNASATTPSEHALIDSVPEALVTIDSKGKIIEVNDHFLDLVHVINKQHLIDRNLSNWLGGSAVDIQVLLTRIKEEGQVRQFATIIQDELGTKKSVAVSAAKYNSGDGVRIGVFITTANRRENQISVPTPGSNNDSSDFAELVGRVPLKDLIREAVDVIEKMCIEAALRQTENNRASAADMLGLSRQSLYIKLRRHGLENFGNE